MNFKNILLGLFLYFFVGINSFQPMRDYPFNPKIHTFGNIGIRGKFHAKVAKYVTKLIDYAAYSNRDIRDEVYKKIIKDYPDHPYILDLCCGVGMSTPKNERCIGIDTSNEMIEEARYLNKKLKNNFHVGNAENVLDTIDFKKLFINDDNFDGFDVTTIFFAFHEIPQEARKDIILYHMKHTKDKMIIVDIDPSYTPSKMMLSGEPYLFDYKDNIKEDLYFAKEDTIVNNHVKMWTIDCSNDTENIYDLKEIKE